MAKNKLLIGFSVALILAIVIGILIIYLISQISPTKQFKTNKITLPGTAIKLSECIPDMGAHYANPAEMPFGPIYLVDKGKVVGIEFAINKNELEKNILSIAGEEVGKPVVMPTLGVKYDHIELSYMPKGHEGDEEAHYDVHMYLTSAKEQHQLCQ